MKVSVNVVRYVIVGIILTAVVVLLVMMASSRSIKNSYHWTKSHSSTSGDLVTEDHVRSLLTHVEDSELGVNIVDLGLVYGITIPRPGYVDVTMTLTTPYCPYSQTIIDDVQKALMADPVIRDIRLRLVFDPAWSWDRVNKNVRKKMIKRLGDVEKVTEERP